MGMIGQLVVLVIAGFLLWGVGTTFNQPPIDAGAYLDEYHKQSDIRRQLHGKEPIRPNNEGV